ncbi:hypothetical protein CAEBREN_02715 [Caenorhabditis brenneri]|uniref:SPK domain-containing protein n=1 Tax=Caenorhabditis brenneri TaxID=135651 RepID=G0NAF7_CAEBE|nr:hypothetical protein CAEBREN_02715 [Caenorhabditis brenneri]
MGRGKAFTAEEERAILEYAFNKVKNDYDFGNKSTNYRKHMKVRLYSIQGVDTGYLLAIGKAHGVSMSDRIKRALEEHSGMSIQLNSEMKIVNWYDKAKLEAKNDIVIKTSNSNYVISWKENEQEKKTGEAGKKEEEKKEKRDGEGKVEEAKEQKVADTKDTKEPKMDDEASDGKNKVEGDDDKTGEEEEMNEKKNGEGLKKKEKKWRRRLTKKKRTMERVYQLKNSIVIFKLDLIISRKADEMKRGRFTKDEEDRMMCYVVETIKKNSSYGLKSNKMSTGDAWSEFSTREEKRNPEKKKSPGSYETHFQKEYQIQIEFKDEKIVGWKFQGTSTN